MSFVATPRISSYKCIIEDISLAHFFDFALSVEVQEYVLQLQPLLLLPLLIS